MNASAMAVAGRATNLASLTRLRPFLVLAPHPDDETLGCGGLIAMATEIGIDVAVVVLTDGSHSHHAPQWPRARLADLRAAEVRSAATVLGLSPDQLFLMDIEDGRLQPDDTLFALVSAIARKTGAETVFVTDPADSHPDHKAAYRLAVRLVAAGVVGGLATYPVGQCFEDGDLSRFSHLDIMGMLDRKQAAVAEHRSQTRDLLPAGSGFRLSSAALGNFLGGAELFRPVSGMDGCLPPDSAEHFDRLFEHSDDPWSYDSSAYEIARHAATISQLGERHFARAWEAGCANGALTAKLLPLCGELISTDVSARAISCAAKRVGPGASFRVMKLPQEVPPGEFDLIMMSDMLYYLGLQGVAAIARICVDRLMPGGLLLLVQWLGETEAALTGEEAAETFLAMAPELHLVRQHRQPGFRLDLLKMPS